MRTPLTLRIVIEQPPGGVDYALQKGSGGNYEPVQRQRSFDGRTDLVFEFQPVAKDGGSIGGPFVQGPPKQRFVYIDIGTYAGQEGAEWARRLKVPLDGITTQIALAGGVWESRVPGTSRDGSPTCATVRDFGGWKAAGM